MSRMLGLLIFVSATGAHAQPLAADPDAYLSVYRAKTSVEPRCSKASGDEISVCGRRAADRYRVPFLVPTPGDPAHEGVMPERERLAASHPDKCGIGAILARCGMAGVHVGTDFSGNPVRLRPLAP